MGQRADRDREQAQFKLGQQLERIARVAA